MNRTSAAVSTGPHRHRKATTPAAATARNIGTKTAYRTPKSRDPFRAAASRTAGGMSTYGAAGRSRGSVTIATTPADHSASMPSGVFISSAAGR